MRNLEGEICGDIQILKLVETNKHKNNKYLCKCKCGNTFYMWQTKILYTLKGIVKCSCIKNPITYKSDYAIIHIKDKEVLVDLDDISKVSFHSWCLNTGGYAVATINKKITLMHRLIFNTTMNIDHINNNKLDNRKTNLRSCTKGQNNYNRRKTQKTVTSKYIGVSYCPTKNKWRTQITHEYKNIFIGYFDSELEGAKAYNEFALKLKGEFAKINLI